MLLAYLQIDLDHTHSAGPVATVMMRVMVSKDHWRQPIRIQSDLSTEAAAV